MLGASRRPGNLAPPAAAAGVHPPAGRGCRRILHPGPYTGGSFILTCKPSSHTTLYEYIQGVETGCLTRTEGRKKKKRRLRCRWMSGLPIRGGKDALEVNWFEVTITSPSGQQLCRNSFATDLPVGPDSVAELADCARSRWKVENNAFKALKDGCHLEHNFGHGKETLSSLLAAFNLIAFLMQSACDLVCESWRARPGQSSPPAAGFLTT